LIGPAHRLIGGVSRGKRQLLIRAGLSQIRAIADRRETMIMAGSARSEIWLRFLDTYRTMCLAPKPEFRRILEEIRGMRFAA
jgi:hypothetical protein